MLRFYDCFFHYCFYNAMSSARTGDAKRAPQPAASLILQARDLVELFERRVVDSAARQKSFQLVVPAPAIRLIQALLDILESAIDIFAVRVAVFDLLDGKVFAPHPVSTVHVTDRT